MKAYQNSTRDANLNEFDLSGKHSWDEVLRIAKDAVAAYQKSGRNGLRNSGRVLSSKSEALLPHLQLIPNGFFTSILCGGLKVVFSVSRSRTPKPL